MPISELRQVVDPLDGSHWKVRPISPDEILEAIDAGAFVDISWQEVSATIPKELHDIFHVRRIAHLVKNAPTESQEHKVMLCMVNDEAWLYDGYHRLAAAIVRGDTELTLSINAAEELIAARLPSAVELAD